MPATIIESMDMVTSAIGSFHNLQAPQCPRMENSSENLFQLSFNEQNRIYSLPPKPTDQTRATRRRSQRAKAKQARNSASP